MISFYLDTSSSYLYTGLVKENKVVQEVKKEYGQELSKVSVSDIITMMDLAKISPDAVDKIFVVTGPGSFTGIRIGVTIAKTYAWALKKEIIEVSGLSAMALSYCGDKKYIMPLIDARRGFVYGALYDREGNKVIEDQYILLSELESLAASYDYDVITNSKVETKAKQVAYSPDILKIVTFYKDKKGINPHLVNPIYLKKTEAEEKQGL